MKKGFTLSEVLIALGIIGIIAALTIPSVMKEYRNRLYVSQLKKAYGQVDDAVKSIMADEHAQTFADTTAAVANAAPSDDFPEGKGPYYFLTKYFKTMKTGCDSTAGSNQCIAASYAPLDGTAYPMDFSYNYCVQTVNGTAICDVVNGTTSTIMIDVNGPADPNVAGRDAFIFNINTDGSLSDWSSDPDVCGTKTREYKHIGDYASGCLTKIIEAGWKMDY